MNIRIKRTGAVLATAIAIVSAAGIANAQQNPSGPTSPTNPTTAQANPGGPRGGFGGMGVLVCSTTNYDDVAAQALGIQSPALRQALVGGQTLTQLATSKNVSIQTVTDALKTAYKADLAQAVTDGLITQTMADQITTELNAAPANATAPSAATNAAPSATQQAAPTQTVPNQTAPNQTAPNGQNAQGPRGLGNRLPGLRPGNVAERLLHVPDHNTVNSFVVASKTIGITCADLEKAVQGGQSIAQVATSKNIQPQAVIDALTAAEKAALTQDVQEGLIGQAQADGQIAEIANRTGAFVYSVGGQRGPQGFGQGGPGSNGFGPGPNGQNPNGSTAPQTAPQSGTGNGSAQPQAQTPGTGISQ